MLTALLKERARALGFSFAGVVDARPSPRLHHYLAWLENQYHGAMGYMARPDRVVRRRDLNVILDGVQSIVCVGLDYASLQLPPAVANDPARGRLSNYAWGVDYHDVMTPRLKELAAWLYQAAGGAVASKVYVDTGAILERDHAAEAGLGFTGKNTMLIRPRGGSYFFLGELLTTAPLTPDAPTGPVPGCGTCTRCLTACPTDAFPRPYVLDARRCISYLTIEYKGWIDPDLRPLLGNWVYGCDVCQDVCPFNRFQRPTAEAGFRPAVLDAAAPPLLDLLALDEDGFNARFARSPVKRLKRDRFMRNVCVAAGNWGDMAAVPLLKQRLSDAAPLVRGHAAWALGRIGDRDGLRAVSAALDVESDDTARAEMARALAAGR